MFLSSEQFAKQISDLGVMLEPIKDYQYGVKFICPKTVEISSLKLFENFLSDLQPLSGIEVFFDKVEINIYFKGPIEEKVNEVVGQYGLRAEVKTGTYGDGSNNEPVVVLYGGNLDPETLGRLSTEINDTVPVSEVRMQSIRKSEERNSQWVFA